MTDLIDKAAALIRGIVPAAGGLVAKQIVYALTARPVVDVGGPNLENVYSPKEYIGFVVKMMLGFGLGFEFPIVLIFMQLIGLVDNKMLRAGRRFALVGIVALVAVLTPSGDPYTLMVLSVPMYLFYEISIAFGWWRSRKQSKNQKQSVKESQSS